MRPRFLLSLFMIMLVVLGGIVLIKEQIARPQPAANPLPLAVQPMNISAPAAAAPVAVAVAIPAPTREEHQATVDNEVERLQNLSGKNDPASKAVILGDLTSPDKDIRLAAIDAIKQSGSASDVPTLQADAAAAPDPDTQAALQDAANFLSLPDAVLAGSGTPVPETPEQIQATQQKFASAQSQRLASIQNHHGPGQSTVQSPSPAQ
jgi:HEAT repeat protein